MFQSLLDLSYFFFGRTTNNDEVKLLLPGLWFESVAAAQVRILTITVDFDQLGAFLHDHVPCGPVLSPSTKKLAWCPFFATSVSKIHVITWVKDLLTQHRLGLRPRSPAVLPSPPLQRLLTLHQSAWNLVHLPRLGVRPHPSHNTPTLPHPSYTIFLAPPLAPPEITISITNPLRIYV